MRIDEKINALSTVYTKNFVVSIDFQGDRAVSVSNRQFVIAFDMKS